MVKIKGAIENLKNKNTVFRIMFSMSTGVGNICVCSHASFIAQYNGCCKMVNITTQV